MDRASSHGPCVRYSRVSRVPLVGWGIGAVNFGIGAVTGYHVLFYVALAVLVAFAAEC
jgi:hypothetical protein